MGNDQILNLGLNHQDNGPIIKEALLALEALGYSKRELTKVEKTLSKETFDSVDDTVKRGLQLLIS